LRVTFNDSVNPATAFWEDKRSPFARVTWTRSCSLMTGIFGGPNRVFSSQLNLVTSELSFTDDDGNNWLPTQGPVSPRVWITRRWRGALCLSRAADATGYPHGIYYCSQDIVTAFCSLSNDGGLTFGPGVPIYASRMLTAWMFPLRRAHAVVARPRARIADGTVYVPNENCSDANNVSRPGVAVSTDNGLTGLCALCRTARPSALAPTHRSDKERTTPFTWDM